MVNTNVFGGRCIGVRHQREIDHHSLPQRCQFAWIVDCESHLHRRHEMRNLRTRNNDGSRRLNLQYDPKGGIALCPKCGWACQERAHDQYPSGHSASSAHWLARRLDGIFLAPSRYEGSSRLEYCGFDSSTSMNSSIGTFFNTCVVLLAGQ